MNWYEHFFLIGQYPDNAMFGTYNPTLVATIAAGIAFLFFMLKKPTTVHYILSGIILGAGMHYTGMAAAVFTPQIWGTK